MHPVILIILAVAVWIMGYRFYGKFLRLGILQLDEDAATPALAGRPGAAPSDRWTATAFHASTGAGLLSIIGAAIAVVWGWVPAFLWVVVGSVVAATVLALGTLWATVRRSGDSLAGLAYDIGGLPAALALFAAGVLLLVLVGGMLGIVLGSLLNAHPETTWPFLALMAVGALLSGSARNAPARIAAGAAIFAAAFVAGQYFPLGLTGSWNFSIRGVEVFGLRHELIWAVIALYIAYRAARVSPGESSHGRGILATALAVTVLVLFIAGTALQGGTLEAPRIQSLDALPPVAALLFIVVTGGALSGMQALVASGATAPALGRQRDVVATGYLGTGLDSLLAVMVIVALAAGFSDRGTWEMVYGTWPVYGGLYIWLDLAITKVALAIAALGLPMPWCIGLVAAMCATLALSMLETALRILSNSVQEFVQDFEFEWANAPSFKQRAAVVLMGGAALVFSQTHVNLQHWLLVGIANQWFACSVLALLALFLWRARRPAALCWAPLVVVGPLTLWGTAWIMVQWVRQGDWGLLALGLLICLTSLIYLVYCGVAAVHMRRQMAETPGSVPPHF